MNRIIESIRNKPPEQRDRLIKISTGVIVVILFIVWLIVGNDRQERTDENFFQSFNDGFNQAKDSLTKLQK